MKSHELKNTHSFVKFQLMVTTIILILSMIISVISVLGWRSKSVEVRMVPINFEKEILVTRDTANDEYYKLIGINAAMTIGNVTPKNANKLIEFFEPFLDYTILQKTRDIMASQVDRIEREKLTTSFNMQTVKFDRSSKKVSVTGIQTTTQAGDLNNKRRRTFEFHIKIEGGRPWITAIDTFYTDANGREKS